MTHPFPTRRSSDLNQCRTDPKSYGRVNPAHLATCDEEAGHLAILDDIDAEARRSARIPPSDGIVTRRACARLIERPVDRETRVVVEPRNMPAHRRGVM